MSSTAHEQKAVEMFNKIPVPELEFAPPTPDLQSRDAPADSKLWRKLDLLVLPLISMIFFLFSLDRYNIGNARVAGMQQALHITDQQYSIALTAQLLYTPNIPSNHLMVVVGPRILIPGMILCGSIVCLLQGVMSNFAGLVACRFWVACFQEFLSTWRHSILGANYNFALGSASAFSGLLSAAIIHMDGIAHKPGWAWIFLLEGLFIVVIALIGFIFLPDSPNAALFLKDSEKTLISDALRSDGILVEGAAKGQFWPEFRRIFTQPHIRIYSTLTSLSTFLPSIVASLGYAGSVAQLMTVPPFAVSAALAILTGLVADRYAVRGLTMIISASNENGVRYGSLFLIVPGVFCIGPPVSAWISNNTAPLVRRATALGLASTIRNLGTILSMWLYGSISPPPRYTSATITLLAFQIGTVICVAGALVHIVMENKRKERMRLEWRVCHGMMVDPPREVPLRNESIWFEYVM
ncbi:MFS general substrate transporter [Lentinus tigrinus ALCF2SS1-6]|uniref:MFS general substrate transporter n=1 Tax=Lentinus tigrinus ALCF2SS1-6 TaxID=1328759 RepID=A0A5C2SM56_9APHY|nr:MFS general substrate transporter [Lentinus tigrinus ALCF2SS1-6]